MKSQEGENVGIAAHILAGYSNVDWAENADNRKSTSRGLFLCG